MLSKFKSEGKIEIPLKHKSSDLAHIEGAKIKGKLPSEIGIPQKTNILINYGESANWSDEKIARDTIQNFYDGNGHNLNDVGFLVEKLQTETLK